MAKVNRDSKLWEKALEAYTADTVIGREARTTVVTKQGRVESMVLMHELRDIKLETARLKIRSREIRKLLAGQKIIKGDYYNRPIYLYALQCADGCWYVGMSRNPERRLKKHTAGKGALWTKKHNPVRIIEKRNTGLTDDATVSRLEDEMTLEYAKRYGTEFVRGGGYCQTSPRWPKDILD